MYFGLVAPAIRVIQETVDKHRKMKIDIRNGIDNLSRELRIIGKNIEKHEDEEFQELAYDIEDFLPDVFVPEARHAVLTALKLDQGTEQLEIINHFLKKVADLTKSQKEEAGGSAFSSVASTGSPESTVLVGTAKSELEDLLSAEDGELRVVTVVGANGLGKTALARDVAQKFNCKAFVVASECIGETIPDKAADLLRKILKEVSATTSTRQAATKDDSSDANQLAEKLKRLLWTRRYLVVLDDVKELRLWEELKRAFPNNTRFGSRIIVTTSIQSVATSLSCGRYRYTMRGLNNEDSRELLLREIYGSKIINQAIVDSSQSILTKCDGSPLALVRAAKHLKSKLMAPEHCKMVGRAFGTEVAGAKQESAFWELKRGLVESYGSLPEYHHRRSLLSIAMSPQGHPINKNSLLRRWIAEGLVSIDSQRTEKDVAFESFDQFIDRSIIDPGFTGSNSMVKRYRVQGIMLEFIVHKSTCATNFATIIDPLIHPGGRLPLKKDVNNRIRRLFVSEGAERCIEEIENHLDFIRWLAIHHSPTSTSIPFDLSKCKLLRVLDLEGCKGIDEEVLANICKLDKSLKYLSLRGSDVRQIPIKITDLVNLVTLDIRETEVEKLPMEVLLMPGLTHLFGKFELVGSHKLLVSQKEKESQPSELAMRFRKATGKKHKEKYFRWESNLETLSGVIIDHEEENLKDIMLHAKKLKKVQIWCKMMNSEYVIPVEKFTGSETLDSLSVHSSNQPIHMLTDRFLKSVSGAWAIQSLKLQGPLPREEGLPVTRESFMKLQLVTELQLSSTGLSWEALSVLQKMSGLLKLKLAEGPHEFGEESFVVEKYGFPSLEQLCIEAPKLPKVQLKNGATPWLVSLELMLSGVTQLENHGTAEISSAQPVALPQIGATPEIPTAEQAAPLQSGAMQGVPTAEPETPYLTGASLENATRQAEAPTQTWVKKNIYAKARNLMSWSQAPVQNGATTEISIHQPKHTTVETVAATAINTHQPEQAAVSNGATSDVTAQQQVDHRVEIRATTGDTSHQPEQNATQIGATSEITTHRPEVLTQTCISEIEVRLGVEGLLNLHKLHEVILHHSTRDMNDWQKVANKHRNKPYIKRRSPGEKATSQAS